jgi:hypothetical protein
MVVEVGWSIAFTINIIINHSKASGIRLQPIQNDVHTFLGVALADAGRRGDRQLNSGPIWNSNRMRLSLVRQSI